MPPVNLAAATKVYSRLFFNQFSRCLLCGNSGPSLLCRDCQDLLQPLPDSLCRCALPLAGADRAGANSDSAPLCGRCVRRPPCFTASVALYPYQFPLDLMIHGLKYQGKLTHERALQQLIAGTSLPWPEIDALCPLPVHWQRRWLRGFDQAERLARLLGRQWRLPLLPALKRQRATPRQQGLKRTQRQRNLRKAFSCQADVQGLHLVLIDDVMTTGSTAREAARILLDNGAAAVYVWTLTRTL